MPRITPHLWFDKEAKEAAALYTSIFPNSRIKSTNVLHDTPSGSVDIVTIDLAGQEFSMISAGPLFKFTPAISFLVVCDTVEEVDALWRELSKDGSVLMELAEYPFSPRYGWTADRYGLSWQIMHKGSREIGQKIIPTMLFVGNVAGKAEEAVNFYTSVFKNARVTGIDRYGKGEEPDKEGTIQHASFIIEGYEFGAMDSAHKHDFSFNEAVSIMVICDTQKEIDDYWDKLSADPKAEQCGWLKDKFGVSWQIVPAAMNRMLSSGNQKKIASLTQAFLQMKKFDIAKLEQAYERG